MTGVWLESTLSFTIQMGSAIQGGTGVEAMKRLLSDCSTGVVNEPKNTTTAQGADLKGTHQFRLTPSDSRK